MLIHDNQSNEEVEAIDQEIFGNYIDRYQVIDVVFEIVDLKKIERVKFYLENLNKTKMSQEVPRISQSFVQVPTNQSIISSFGSIGRVFNEPVESIHSQSFELVPRELPPIDLKDKPFPDEIYRFSLSFNNWRLSPPNSGISNYVILDKLGQGSYGQTFLAQNIHDSSLVALKIISIDPRTPIPTLAREVRILMHLSNAPNCHPAILCYHDAFRQNVPPDNFYIVTEYIRGLTFKQYVQSLKNPQTNPTQQPPPYDYLWSLMRELIFALDYIHSKAVAHRDIKPDNIMLTENHEIKIIDFGLSCDINCQGRSGTLLYMSPEMLEPGYYRIANLETEKKHDVWSLGVVFFELANLKMPFHEHSRDLFQQDLRNGWILKSAYQAEDRSKSLRINNIINMMMQSNPTVRWSTGQIIQYINLFERRS